MKKVQSVNAYIAAAPEEVRAKLRAIRAAIKKAAPKAEEKISYGMPYYAYQGRLAYFAYAKQHIGLYAMPPVVQDHQKELKKYRTSTATIRFPLKEKLPVALIKKLVKAGVKNNEMKKICSRGHAFTGRGPCPVCWPGRLKKGKQ